MTSEVHISSPVPSMCLRAKDNLEGTKVAVSPSLCATQERPVRQRSGLAVTEEWRPGRRRAIWLPEEEQATQRDELSGRRCHASATSGLHWSWLTLVYARSGNLLRSVHPCVNSTRQSWHFLYDYCFSVDAFRTSDGLQLLCSGPGLRECC